MTYLPLGMSRNYVSKSANRSARAGPLDDRPCRQEILQIEPHDDRHGVRCHPSRPDQHHVDVDEPAPPVRQRRLPHHLPERVQGAAKREAPDDGRYVTRGPGRRVSNVMKRRRDQEPDRSWGHRSVGDERSDRMPANCSTGDLDADMYPAAGWASNSQSQWRPHSRQEGKTKRIKSIYRKSDTVSPVR